MCMSEGPDEIWFDEKHILQRNPETDEISRDQLILMKFHTDREFLIDSLIISGGDQNKLIDRAETFGGSAEIQIVGSGFISFAGMSSTAKSTIQAESIFLAESSQICRFKKKE